jgi:cell division protein FtsB
MARRRSSGWLGASVLIAASVALAGYFAHHMLHGRHGLDARWRLIERRVVVERDIAVLQDRAAGLRRDVDLLGPDIGDPDLVEEIAREVLGFGRSGDIVIRSARTSG